MGEVAGPPVSLELVLAQLAAKEQYCKELENSQKTLQQQVQELLQDSQAGRSVARKEKQWESEKAKLTADLEAASFGLSEKEGLVHELERDLRATKSAVERLQGKAHEAERWKERESMAKERLQADLEDARLAIEDLEKSCSLKDEAAAKQRRAMGDLSKKMESQKKELEKTMEDARRKAQQLDEMELEHRTATERLGEKSKQLLSLREDYEKLRAAHKGMQSDGVLAREDVLKKLEESEVLREEQEGRVRKLEKELRKMKTQAKQLETRCAAAEADAKSKSASLTTAQAELEAAALSAAEVAEAKEEAASLKAKLVGAERDLAQEVAVRVAAEGALQDYKQREEHLLKVEEGHSELQGKAKWRNEQFASLEEAYAKLRAQFRESQGEWEAERAQMVKEIDGLRDGLEAKGKLAQHLHTQLDMLQQALDHEHIHHKGLEQELAEAKSAMGTASAEVERARSAFDAVREEMGAKIALLDRYVAARERQIRETELKEEGGLNQGPGSLDAESRRENAMQEAAEVHGEQSMALEVAGTSKGTILAWEGEKEELLRVVRDAEASLACKETRLRELGIEISGTRSLLHVLQDPHADPYQLEPEERNAGEAAHGPVADTVHRAEDVANDGRKAETAAVPNQEAATMDAASLQQQLGRYKEQEAEMLALQEQCRGLRELLKQRDAQQKKMQGAQDKAMAQLQAEGKAWQDERAKLVGDLVAFEGRGLEQEKRHREMQSDMERLRGVVGKLEARGAALEQQIAEQSVLAELATGQLAIERAEGERLKRESQLLTASFEAALAAKDASFEELRGRFRELEDMYAGSAQAIHRESARASTLEKRLEAQQALQGGLEQRVRELSAELAEAAGKAEQASRAEDSLHDKLRSLEGDLRSTKQAFRGQLEALDAKLSLSQDQLHEAAQQLGSASAEMATLVEELGANEAETAAVRAENKSLAAEKARLEGVAETLEARKLELVREAEGNKAAIERLCAAREVAEASLAAKSGELQDIYNKLGYADTMRLQLQIAEEKAQAMESTLGETRAAVEDKEERLAASEWAVQQLASEIAKAKHSLAQKEREEAFLQERLSDLERHLRDKEREMAAMEAYLDTVVQSNEAKQADLDVLTLKMEDLKKGADEWKQREIDLEMELHRLRGALEEKDIALAESTSAALRAAEAHGVMEGAIASLKQQLAERGAGSATQRGEMDRMCADLESAKAAASSGDAQLQGLSERLQQLERSSEDRLRKAQSTSDELQRELLSTQSRLHSCEQRLEVAEGDLAQYKERCTDLLQAVAKKASVVEEMEAKLASAESDLARQARVVEQAAAERARAQQDLLAQAAAQRALERAAAATERQLGDVELHKERTEQEVRWLKKALDTARREAAAKAAEADRYRGELEQLQEISEQYGDAQVLISRLTGELQLTSSTVEERDCRLSKLQSALAEARAELRASRDALAGTEDEREVLAVKLTVAESRIEASRAEAVQMQEVVACAETRWSAEAMNVLLHVAALKKAQAELDEWKEKAASLADEGEAAKRVLELSLRDVHAELLGWKVRAEDAQAENSELESAVQNLQSELEGWKERAAVAAQEGRVVREQLDTAIRSLQGELEGWKRDAAAIEDAGMDADTELRGSLKMLQSEVEERSGVAGADVAKVALLSAAAKALHGGLRGWRDKAVRAAANGRLVREELEHSIADLRAELEDWKARASAAGAAEARLRGEFAGFVEELRAEAELWKSAAEGGSARKLELERAVEDLHLELSGWKERAAAAVDEERRVKMTHEASLVELQEELGAWKEKAAAAADESAHLQAAFAASMKEIETELRNWKQRAVAADAELEGLKAEVCQAKDAAAAAAAKGGDERLALEASLRDATSELQEHCERATTVAEETRHLQSELQRARAAAADLAAQLERQKGKEAAVEKLTLQLELDLETAREEALTRKEKMLHILAQLESTHASQKELQAQLKSQHDRLLHDDEPTAADFAFREAATHSEPLLHKKNVQRLGSARELVAADDNGRLEDEASSLPTALASQNEVRRLAADLETALGDLSAKNLAVRELKSEISGLRSSLAQLESRRHTTEEALRATEVERIYCRNGLQREDCPPQASGPQPPPSPHKAGGGGNPAASQLPSVPSPRRRPRSLLSPLQVKPAPRAAADTAGSGNILGEVDENSLARCPRSPSPLAVPRKPRDHHLPLFTGSPF